MPTRYLSDADLARLSGYPETIVDEDLRREAEVDDEVAAHLSPALVDHINPYGRFLFDVHRQLTRTSRRPLRRPGAPIG